MRFPEQPDDGELETTALDTPPAHLPFARRGGLSKRGRVTLAVVAIALAIIAPLIALSPTRAALAGLLPTPAPTPVRDDPLTIISVDQAPTIGVSAAEWAKLRGRPLQLPRLNPGASCPAAQGQIVESSYGPAIGDGPAYVVGMGTDGILQATGPVLNSKPSATWGNQFALFIIDPRYQGAVLARGGQIDGNRPLLFNGGLDQLNNFDQTTPTLLGQLRLASGPAYGAPWPSFPAYLRMQSTGCYAIQFDGDTFSEIVVFRVVFGE